MSLESLPEVFFSTASTTKLVSRYVREGKVRKIGTRLYTKNMKSAPEEIIRRNIWDIVASYVPGAIIADRTAIEIAPAADGSVFVISNLKRNISLPGITIRPRKGAPPMESDKPYMGALFLSSTPRAFLENMKSSRLRNNDVKRTLSQEEIEEQLENIIRYRGVDELNKLRQDAATIAEVIGLQKEFEKLDLLISGLLGTREVELKSELGIARASGYPFDSNRIELFGKLLKQLRMSGGTNRSSNKLNETEGTSIQFFEAYFSNFIEGIEFEVTEAKQIIFENQYPQCRSRDAHDLLGTWNIVSNKEEMIRTPESLEQLLGLLRERHGQVMSARPEANPGEFKDKPNRAGDTVFVEPDLVIGTLGKGFEMYGTLSDPFSKAVFMMYLIAEVHPFADGNGRVARIMMNSELVATNQTRIIIPTVFYTEYIGALRAMSGNGLAEPLIRVLDFAQEWVASITWGNIDKSKLELERCNAFKDPRYADREGYKLILPQ